jgi:hypothetical protein
MWMPKHHLIVVEAVRPVDADYTLRAGELVRVAGYPGSDRVWDFHNYERGIIRLHERHVREATPAEVAAVAHDRAMNTPDGIVCDCGHPCADMAEWHAHTVRTYNSPSPDAVRLRGRSVHTLVITIEPGTVATVERCTKVACSGAGNGLECWRIPELRDPDSDSGRTVGLFGLRSEAVARDILANGATLSRTYTMNVC